MRKKFVLNNILVFVWLALTGNFTLYNFLFGFLIGYLALWVVNSDTEGRKYFMLIPRSIGFVFFFLWELLKANFQVAIEVITPPMNMKPGIVSVPLDAKSDLEITLLANLISLTPGTLSLDVSEDRSHLFVHAMYIEDRQEFIDGIKNGFEKRLLQLLR